MQNFMGREKRSNACQTTPLRMGHVLQCCLMLCHIQYGTPPTRGRGIGLGTNLANQCEMRYRRTGLHHDCMAAIFCYHNN